MLKTELKNFPGYYIDSYGFLYKQTLFAFKPLVARYSTSGVITYEVSKNSKVYRLSHLELLKKGANAEGKFLKNKDYKAIYDRKKKSKRNVSGNKNARAARGKDGERLVSVGTRRGRTRNVKK